MSIGGGCGGSGGDGSVQVCGGDGSAASCSKHVFSSDRRHRLSFKSCIPSTLWPLSMIGAIVSCSKAGNSDGCGGGCGDCCGKVCGSDGGAGSCHSDVFSSDLNMLCCRSRKPCNAGERPPLEFVEDEEGCGSRWRRRHRLGLKSYIISCMLPLSPIGAMVSCSLCPCAQCCTICVSSCLVLGACSAT